MPTTWLGVGVGAGAGVEVRVRARGRIGIAVRGRARPPDPNPYPNDDLQGPQRELHRAAYAAGYPPSADAERRGVRGRVGGREAAGGELRLRRGWLGLGLGFGLGLGLGLRLVLELG